MNDWGLYGRAYECIALALSNNPNVKRVTCILPPISGHNFGKFADIHKYSQKLAVVTPLIQSIDENKTGYRLRKWLNQSLHLLHLLYLRYYLFINGAWKSNTILWLYPPHIFIHDLLRTIPFSKLVIQIVDNNTFRENDDVGNKFSEIQYNNLADKADLIITSSLVNFNIFSKKNINCCFIENGVGHEFLSTPSDFPYKSNKSKPRLGYVGWISQRTDIELMRHIALTRPNYILIVAGPDENGLLESSGIVDLPNVEYIGSIPQNQVPDFLRYLDVCLIPHKDNAYSRSMSPLKLFQYLASGRPVVSTRVAGTEKWESFILLADSYDAFVENIDKTLLSDNQDKSLSRITAVKKENWDSKVSTMLDKLNLFKYFYDKK